MHADTFKEIWILFLLMAAPAVVFVVRFLKLRICSPICWITPCKAEKIKELSDAFTDLSHNLQTPLAVLKGRVEEFEHSLLHDGPSRDLVHSIDAVSGCINDLLSYTRLEHALKTEERKRFSLTVLVQELYEDISVVAEDRGIEVSLESASEIFLFGNERRIREAVMNLLCNAVKYMGDRPVRKIHLTLLERSGKALLEVRDTGIGIPKHELPRIFERFYRGSNRTYGTIPGTGLGLAIVERVVKEHGGTVTVKSEIGTGSLFKLVLPLPKQARFRKTRS